MQTHGFFRRRLVDCRDCSNRLAAITHFVARQWMLGARDWKDAKPFVAIRAGDDRLYARQLRRFGDIDVEDFGVRVRTTENTASEHSRHGEIGSEFGAA